MADLSQRIEQTIHYIMDSGYITYLQGLPVQQLRLYAQQLLVPESGFMTKDLLIQKISKAILLFQRRQSKIARARLEAQELRDARDEMELLEPVRVEYGEYELQDYEPTGETPEYTDEELLEGVPERYTEDELLDY